MTSPNAGLVERLLEVIADIEQDGSRMTPAQLAEVREVERLAALAPQTDHALVVGLGQVRYILKSVANGDDQREAARKAVEIVDAAIDAALAALPTAETDNG